MSNTKCEKCGEVIPFGAEWCPHCGQMPKGIRVRHIVFAVGVLILLALLIAGVMLHFGH